MKDVLADTAVAGEVTATPVGIRAAQTPLAVGARVGRYVIERVLGAGGMGMVYAARDPKLDRPIAIKVLHAHLAELRMRLLREGQAVARLRHGNVVTIHDVGEYAQGLFIAMELLDGVTLRAWLDAAVRSPTAILDVFRDAGRGLAAAHGVGLVHRDFKPENVLIESNGRVVVTDFGLARSLDRDAPVASAGSDDVGLTQTGAILGTPAYMSPEQFRGDTVGPASDQFSFCVALFEALHGLRPFAGKTLEEIRERVLRGDLVVGRATLPVRVTRAIARGLATDPAARYPTIEALLDELAPPKRRRMALAVASVGISGAIAATAIAWPRSATVVDTCELGSARLVGVWDPATRAKLAAHFGRVARPDVAATWKRISTDLDAYTTEWAKRWDDACHASDKVSDPLLHAQRLTCLETAHVALRGLERSLANGDPGQLSEGLTREFVEVNTSALAGCADLRRLREQRPAPAPDKRASVDAAGEEWRLGRAQARLASNAGRQEELERGLAKMAHAADQLEALGESGANETNWWASYHVNRAQEDATWIPKARAAIAIARRRAEAARDDSMIVAALREQLRIELLARSPDVRRALADLVAAAARGGLPEPLEMQIEVAEYDRRFDEAIGMLRRYLAAKSDPTVRAHLGRLLTHLGRHDEAIAVTREDLAEVTALLGAVHVQTATSRVMLGGSLHAAGRHEDALAEYEAAESIYEQIGTVAPERKVTVLLPQLELARRLNRANVSARVEKALASNAVVVRIAFDRSMWNGWLDVGERLIPHLALDAGGDHELRGFIAFRRGDVEMQDRHASAVPAERPDETDPRLGSHVAPWLVAIAEAKRGRVERALALVPALLATKESSSDDVNGLRAVLFGILYATTGKWTDAKTWLERAEAIGTTDRGEVDAWLGLVLLELGDRDAARVTLLRSLDAANACCAHDYEAVAKGALARIE